MARNSEIPEELGRVQFVLSDKTGTLTQNEMIFKVLSMENGKYDHTETDVLKKILKKQCDESLGPMKDIFDIIEEEEQAKKTNTIGNSDLTNIGDDKGDGKKKKKHHQKNRRRQIKMRDNNINPAKKGRIYKRKQENLIRDTITALILCHNVTPVIEDGKRFFQASSPDEIA